MTKAYPNDWFHGQIGSLYDRWRVANPPEQVGGADGFLRFHRDGQCALPEGDGAALFAELDQDVEH